MKKAFLSALFGAFALAASAQIPSATLKTLDGADFDASKLANDGKPLVVSFWATWCKPCITELINIDDVYEDWQKETGVKLVAISIDDARTMTRVKPFVTGKGWTYEMYLDPNSDFRRAMNVNNVPHTFIFDGTGKLVYQHTAYQPGHEAEYIKVLRDLAAKK